MIEHNTKQNGPTIFVLAMVVLIVITGFSFVYQIWFLIAIPVGFLFGSFYRKVISAVLQLSAKFC